MDQIARVQAALERSVLPSVIARGGGLRLIAVEDGVVILEAAGSPGATLPLVSRIEAQLKAAVPGITSLRVLGLGGAPPSTVVDADIVGRVGQVLDDQVNAVIAAHRGHVTLVGVDRGWVRIRLEGGCQGCSLAEVTLRQGIEPLLRARIPEITGIIDVTDHAAGTDPFFSPAKR